MNTEGRDESIGERKARHLDICLDAERYDVESGSTALDGLHLAHRALPELAVDEVDLGVDFLGARLSSPIFVSCMTGGPEAASSINRNLALAAQKAGIAVGTGSVRVFLRNPELIDQFRLKRYAPDVPVFANLGAVQARDLDGSAVVELLKRLEVQGVALHLNAGQELFQARGDRDFRGVLDGIAKFCAVSPVPVIVKETGFGISPAEAFRLIEAGVSYVDLAGAGGTNWIAVEGTRLDGTAAAAAREFAGWGNPTGPLLAAMDLRPTSLRIGAAPCPAPAGAGGPAGQEEASSRGTSAADSRAAAALGRVAVGRPTGLPAAREVATPWGESLRGRVLASGGLRSGMDLVKALALGASLGGYALPFLRAAASSPDGVLDLIERYTMVLRSAMVMTGCRTVVELGGVPLWADYAFEAAVRALRNSAGGPA